MRVVVLHGCCKAPQTRSMVMGESADAVIDGLRVSSEEVKGLSFTCVLNRAVNAEKPGKLALPKDCHGEVLSSAPPEVESDEPVAPATSEEWAAYEAEVNALFATRIPEIAMLENVARLDVDGQALIDERVLEMLGVPKPSPVVWAALKIKWPDVAGYLVSERVRNRLHQFVRGEVGQTSEPYVLIGHSLGSIIGYDLINREILAPSGYLTAGSPMVLKPIRKRLGKPRGDWPPWLNLSDPSDVAVDDTALEDTEVGGERFPSKTKWVDNPPPDGDHDLYGYLTATGVSDLWKTFVNGLS